MEGFSSRGSVNLTRVLARIPPNVLNPVFDRHEVDLSMAENRVIRNEILGIVKHSIDTSLQPQHLDWPKGFFGDPKLLDALAASFNNYFHPYSPIEQHQIAISAGAAAGLEAILYNICNPGDGVLVPCPYWGGYDALFALHSEVRLVGVQVSDLQESLGPALIRALEEQYQTAPCPIKALVLSNPHNPLGRPYPRAVLEQCMAFYHRRQIHLISDEVFALSTFASPDFTEPSPFVSCLSIDPTDVACDPEQVHVVWSVNKDLAASGVRLDASQLGIKSFETSSVYSPLDYAGYHFPRGVDFLINTIALSQEFEDADTFDPERWLDGNESNVTHNLWAFGSGRRICVGYQVAQQALYVAIVRLIFCFDLISDGPVDNRKLNHMSLSRLSVFTVIIKTY